ncbi:serine hydrolase [Kutzneria buriramensis]|uniref:CubicO group peptidase (Beta-lactamase class C family) n=1 Tax=Kutzneria buriramensis TaxID=1045776 RepID=A0A3E0H1S8_9PSEU|nr:serine hydrolase domain-containing protein [Kutzneria buriramensis]REH36224.1 CubicO group peptidase (beta-lactamase class C family) [Kutzneria buriramensis]
MTSSAATIRSVVDKTSLEHTLSGLVDRHGVPAAQLSVHTGGETITVGAAGKYPIGSITKPFTATLAMLLVADGDLDLEDRLAEHLGDLGPRVGELTVRQLLSHTSGLPAAVAGENSSTRQYLRACRDAELVLRPGVGFSYSNVGYVLLSRLVEEITGMDWWEAVEALLLTPLGIEPAFTVEPGGKRSTDTFVTGHARRGVPVDQTLSEVEAGAGALALSAEDLVTFGLMHVTGDGPLSPQLLRTMRRQVPGVVPFGLANGWGLGLAVFDGWVGHDGTADGTSCHLRINPTGGQVVALTTNAVSGAALWVDLVGRLRELGLDVADYDLSQRHDEMPMPAGLTGSYANGDMEYFVDAGDGVLRVGGELYPELTVHRDWAFSVLEPESGRRVLGGRFLRDPSTGRIHGLQTGGRVAARR